MIFLITLLLLKSPVFIKNNDIVLPHTNVRLVRNAPLSSGIMLYIDGKWAYYEHIAPLVFVRKSISYTEDTLESGIEIQQMPFDLNGDGKFERITFKNATLTINQGGRPIHTFYNVKSFVFFDCDNNNSLDLLYTDKEDNLYFFKNTSSISNYATIKSKKTYEILYSAGKRTYKVQINPYIFSGIIPLNGWDRVMVMYNNIKIPLKKGSLINTEEAISPIEHVSFNNDTLKLSLKFVEKTTYTIYLRSKNKVINIADGTLPEGTYNFDYFVGKLQKGEYTLSLKTNNKEFNKKITVE